MRAYFSYPLSCRKRNKTVTKLGSLKCSVDDFAEPLSRLVSEDVTLMCVAARVSNFPGQRVLVFNNLRRVLCRLQGRQRGFQALLHLDVCLDAVDKGLEVARLLAVLRLPLWPAKPGATNTKRESHRRRRVTRIRRFMDSPGRKGFEAHLLYPKIVRAPVQYSLTYLATIPHTRLVAVRGTPCTVHFACQPADTWSILLIPVMRRPLRGKS